MQPEAWDRLARTPLYLDQTSTRLRGRPEPGGGGFTPRWPGRLLARHPPRGGAGSRSSPARPAAGRRPSPRSWQRQPTRSPAEETAVLVGLDGWHYPNAYLDSHTIERDGATLPMRRFKGSPETYDTGAAYACLEQAPVRSGCFPGLQPADPRPDPRRGDHRALAPPGRPGRKLLAAGRDAVVEVPAAV